MISIKERITINYIRIKKGKYNMATEKGKINFNYNLLKGKIAELIIEQLFRDLGFEIFPYGIETKIPNYQKVRSSLEKETKNLNPIRSNPDFFIHHPELKIAKLIEVKFRKDKCLEHKGFANYYNEDALFIMVTKDGIKYANSQEISNHFQENPNQQFGNFKSLIDIDLLKLTNEQKRVIRQCEGICKIVFGNLPTNDVVIKDIFNVAEPICDYLVKD